MTSPPPPKPCAVCGRAITWRRKWARDWEQVRYCSDAVPGEADRRAGFPVGGAHPGAALPAGRRRHRVSFGGRPGLR
ncbi:DUF2256 domain-containing protein [Corallococcus carmarthensis]|uniref:DUF2256 domain-containing protein n=1 Tax=Corallococcus carmarthensis TaxID=2316728 RepID=UPI0034E0AEAE